MTTKIVALWRTPEDTEGFEKHYAGTHIPLALALPGLKKGVISKAVNGPYYRMAELKFENSDALMQAFGSPEAQKLMEDTAHMQATYGVEVDVLTVEEDPAG
jgi:uncharacterized protein (TIGR02118 family)